MVFVASPGLHQESPNLGIFSPLTGMAMLASSWQGLKLGGVTIKISHDNFSSWGQGWIIHFSSNLQTRWLKVTEQWLQHKVKSRWIMSLHESFTHCTYAKIKCWFNLGSDSLSAVMLGIFWNEVLRGGIDRICSSDLWEMDGTLWYQNQGNILLQKVKHHPLSSRHVNNGFPLKPRALQCSLKKNCVDKNSLLEKVCSKLTQATLYNFEAASLYGIQNEVQKLWWL